MDLAFVTAELVSPSNPDEGDIYVAEDGDTRMLDGVEAEALAIATRLDTFLGEWFLNTSAGTPWREKIFAIKGVAPSRVRELLRPVIMERGTVKEIVRLDVTIDADRKATVGFEVILTSGETAEGSV